MEDGERGDIKREAWMLRETDAEGVRGVRGIYGPGSYCSCTRESAQLEEKREMGCRCTVSNTEA